jgi:hypothetical protein
LMNPLISHNFCIVIIFTYKCIVLFSSHFSGIN